MTDKIEGPLGIWPWPILNTLIMMKSDDEDNSMKVTEVNRDSNGRITSIEEFEK